MYWEGSFEIYPAELDLKVSLVKFRLHRFMELNTMRHDNESLFSGHYPTIPPCGPRSSKKDCDYNISAVRICTALFNTNTV